MNKIVLGNGKIISKEIDKSLKVEIADKDKYLNVKSIHIDICEDTSLFIEVLASNKMKFDFQINILKGVTCNIFEIKKQGIYKVGYKYFLEDNSTLNITRINDVEATKEMLIFNLNKNSNLNYLFKTISKNEEKYDLIIYHDGKESKSNIINHGVNLLNGELSFDVSGFVPKGIKACEVEQKNQIINLTNNKCEIKPNLFIDEQDVIANHSAHIGKCNENELFYLNSRGISEKDAERLIIKGFLTKKLENKEIMEEIIQKYWTKD